MSTEDDNIVLALIQMGEQIEEAIAMTQLVNNNDVGGKQAVGILQNALEFNFRIIQHLLILLLKGNEDSDQVPPE